MATLSVTVVVFFLKDSIKETGEERRRYFLDEIKLLKLKDVSASGKFRNSVGNVYWECAANTHYCERLPAAGPKCSKSKNVSSFAELPPKTW